ncbi:hypothetical protein HPB52_024985 [Rhipicephalus sanguineus]|uniref:Histidine ammonia-lyase n=1 Tax=Rhipicephalus sanguineus TaxID=34632 RepID=A0A9D4YRV0_RHISA|nr:hypothetical protein HPB52_024985 [Rhipicephalus sanguineus]
MITIDGNNLTPGVLLELGKGNYKIQLSSDSIERVRMAREMLEAILKENKVAYGINTGFGKFARVVIPDDSLKYPHGYMTRKESSVRIDANVL